MDAGRGARLLTAVDENPGNLDQTGSSYTVFDSVDLGASWQRWSLDAAQAAPGPLAASTSISVALDRGVRYAAVITTLQPRPNAVAASRGSSELEQVAVRRGSATFSAVFRLDDDR